MTLENQSWRVFETRRNTALAMGATPSHGITMGYVSDPFRTEEQNPDPERVALPAHGETMGRGAMTLENQSWRVFETRRHTPQEILAFVESVRFSRNK